MEGTRGQGGRKDDRATNTKPIYNLVTLAGTIEQLSQPRFLAAFLFW